MTTTPLEAAHKLAEEYGVNVNGSRPMSGFNPVTAAQALLDSGLHIARGGGEVYSYDSDRGIYRPAAQLLRKRLTGFLGEEWRPNRARDILT